MTKFFLTEYKSQTFQKEEIPEAIAAIIDQQYGSLISINWNWRENVWQLSPKGYIGIIPITSDFSIYLKPKTKIKYIWQMLDWVDNLDSLKIFETLSDGDAIEELCDRLACLLAQKIIRRTKQGLHRAYLPEQARLMAPRGRIQWQKAARQPWETRLPCQYSNQTADVPDNQILLWTLYQLGRTSYLFKPASRQQLRTAYRALQHSISLESFTAADCKTFTYHRLNEDYKLLHQLCYFFLANLSPTHHHGETKTIPFLLNTAVLYEKFVFAWLKKNLPEQYELKDQVQYKLSNKINYHIDLVLYDKQTKKAIAVLDTKYKTPDKPSNNDLNQIIAYAIFKRCHRAILIYPENLPHPVNCTTQDIQIKTLTFALNSDLNEAGQNLLDALFLNPSQFPSR